MKTYVLDAPFFAAVEAIGQGDRDSLLKLLEAHPEIVNARTPIETGQSGDYFAGAMLLHYTAANPYDIPLPQNVIEMMEILLRAGAEVDATTNVGNTTLALVSSSGPARDRGLQTSMIDFLIGRGANPNVTTHIRSPLENALLHGVTGGGHSLVRHGAKVDLRLAAALGRIDLMEGFFAADGSPNRSAYELLPPLGEGCNLDLTDAEVFELALGCAVNNWQFEAIDFLLDKGADINGRLRNWPPLHNACDNDTMHTHRTEPRMVEYLLERGADKTLRSGGEADATPFQVAVHNGHARIVAYMLDRGGFVREDDLDNELYHAVEQGFPDVAGVLIDGGASSANVIIIAERVGDLAAIDFLKEVAAG